MLRRIAMCNIDDEDIRALVRVSNNKDFDDNNNNDDYDNNNDNDNEDTDIKDRIIWSNLHKL